MATFPLVVLISGHGSNLQAIIDHIQEGSLDAEICAVISNRNDAFGLTRAKKYNIPTEMLLPRNYSTKDDYDTALLSCLQKYSPALIILAGFMKILRPRVVDTYPHKILNIHPSLLPLYPGLNTHEKVLRNADHKHGSTIHIVTNELDNGPIISQASFKVPTHASLEFLETKIKRLEHALYSKVIQYFAQQSLFFINDKLHFKNVQIPNSGLQFTEQQLL